MIPLLDAASALAAHAAPTRGTTASASLVLLADDVDWPALRVRGRLPSTEHRPLGLVLGLPGEGGDVIVSVSPSGLVHLQEAGPHPLPELLPVLSDVAWDLRAAVQAAARRRARAPFPHDLGVLSTEGCFGGSADPVRWREGILGLGRGWVRHRGEGTSRLLRATHGSDEGRLRTLWDPATQSFWPDAP